MSFKPVDQRHVHTPWHDRADGSGTRRQAGRTAVTNPYHRSVTERAVIAHLAHGVPVISYDGGDDIATLLGLSRRAAYAYIARFLLLDGHDDARQDARAGGAAAQHYYRLYPGAAVSLASLAALTPRQRDYLPYLLRGTRYHAIMAALYVTQRCVENTLKLMRTRLDLATRAEITALLNGHTPYSRMSEAERVTLRTGACLCGQLAPVVWEVSL